MKPSRSEFITVRGLRYHVRQWGDPGAPKLFMAHGWMDVSASFQFMVDCLQREWHVLAPDWRGFGLTDRGGADHYWFLDYLGDLDAILEHYCPGGEPVNLLGHSMGGNAVCLYAGARPAWVAKLVNLEGFGMPPSRPEQAPDRYAQWLDELREPARLRAYASQAEVAQRLKKADPRLSDERAAFLSGHWARENRQGQWELLADPAHKRISPLLYHVEDAAACWRNISAPVLWVEAEHSEIWRAMGSREEARAELDRRIRCFPDVRTARIADAGHMLHHDQPQAVAQLVEDFLCARKSGNKL